MFGGLVVLSALLASPETDAAQLLKVAWASQYEWKESDVKNITLDFQYTGTNRFGDKPQVSEGTGQIVVVGEVIVRRHVEGLSSWERDRLYEQLKWIVDRFVRKPFDEVFKDAKFGAAEEMVGGRTRIPVDNHEYILLRDRIVGLNVGPKKVPAGAVIKRVPFRYTLAEVSDGYTISAETSTVTGPQNTKVVTTRVMKLGEVDEVPVPRSLNVKLTMPRGRLEAMIEFTGYAINLDDPIAGDPGARDLLKKAWERRYVLPAALRVTGDYRRKPVGNAPRWITDDVKGEFQVWGMDDIQAQLKGKRYDKWGADRIKELNDRATAQIRFVFDLLKPSPFDEEFKNCGFRFQPDKKGDRVDVLGHATMASFVIDEDRIVATLNHGPTEIWWDHKIKATREGNLIREISRKIDGEKYAHTISYKKTKGYSIPSKFQTLRRNWRPTPPYYVVEYKLTRVRVELP